MKVTMSGFIITMFLLGIAFAEETSVDLELSYPIDYCLVSGEELGSMGDPVVIEHEGREIRLCCAHCIEAFQNKPAKYLKKLDKAITKSQSKDYPLSTCVVSGEELGSMGTPVKYIYRNQLVQFCCSGCIDTFNEHPDAYLKQIIIARGSSDSPE